MVTARFAEWSGTIRGVVWWDADGNGVRGPQESGIPGVTLQLLFGGLQIRTDTTRSDGSYSFASLLAGEYEVREVQPSGYHYSSTPDDVRIGVLVGRIAPLDFGDWNFRVAYLSVVIRPYSVVYLPMLTRPSVKYLPFVTRR
jgi:hypothetical protein